MPSRVLVVRLSALGDILHTIPALTTLRRHLPSAHLAWLVEDAGAGLLEGHSDLTELHVIPRQQWARLRRSGQRWAAVREFIACLRQIRSLRFDLVIDFQGLAKSGFWISQVNCPRKAGFGPGLPRNEGAWLALNERIQPPSSEVHALDRNLRLLECLGYPRLPIRYHLPAPAAADLEAASLLHEVDLENGTRFVAINPMTRWPTKNWTPELFAATADLLVASGLPVVFTGAPGDRGSIDAITQRMQQRARRLDGRTSLPTLSAIYRRAAVLLSTDTGPMHLAAAVETPVVALFGPTAPWRTGPHGNGHRVLRLELPCSPCFKKTCLATEVEAHACLRRLDPREVARVVHEVVARLDASTPPAEIRPPAS
ncbi:MAG: glycosyltransferase family 9 protein [Verrucomicrobiales bacterium]|nr:glycosyltransferase family 9 protein [Verrucomicrobiales bacterium]